MGFFTTIRLQKGKIVQQISNKVASRSELLELVETLGMYAQIEQPSFKQRQPVSSLRRVGRLPQLLPVQLKNSVSFRLANR